MELKSVFVGGEVLCKGLQLATSRSEQPVLCLVRPEAIKLVAVSGLRLVASWEARLFRPAPDELAFLFPPLVAELLSSEAIRLQEAVEFMVGSRDVVVRLADHLGRYDLHWQYDLASFPAPEAFAQIMKVPEVLMDVPYLKLSDVTHAAVAKLIRIEAEEQVNPQKLAILIDLDFGRLCVNGQEIISTGSRQYYFDPRLVIRALEFIKERTLAVGITSLPGGRRGYLSLVAEQEGWTVHCSLLSIGHDTQKLYPLPRGRNR